MKRKNVLDMENDLDFLLRLFGEGMTIRTEKFGVSGVMANVENRNKEKKICFLAKDEKEARETAKEWMLGQMLLGYKDLREVTLFLANRVRITKDIENGNC